MEKQTQTLVPMPTLYIVFGAISILLAIGALIYALCLNRKGRAKGRTLSPLNIFTIGIFLSIVAIFVPIYYLSYDFSGNYKIFRPLLISLHTALRVFIVDGEFNVIRDEMIKFKGIFPVLYSLYAALLYVVAPILTVSNLLSLFENLRGELRFFFQRKRPLYIMSALNDRSLAMAKSIAERNKASKTKALIVFTGVTENGSDDNYDQLLAARQIKAVCLKKDVSVLNVKRKSGRTVEFFLLDENESANIEHAISLTEQYKTRKNTAIYLFAVSPVAGYVIDSLDKGHETLDESFINLCKENPEKILYENEWKDRHFKIDGGFYIRRLNNVDNLVMNTLADEQIITPLLAGASEEKTISIMIVGMGSYGSQFLKSALWFYQISGYKLELNVFDAADNLSSTPSLSVEQRLGQECPEIVKINPSHRYGDANYDIRFFNRIDCFSADFDALFEAPETAERLKRTQLVFVTLGDDDKNIEASVMLRKLFDRIKCITNKKVPKSDLDELPMICSIVYDDRKAANLGVSGKSNILKDYRGTPYHIRFIGNMSSQYSYGMIEAHKNREREAFLNHIDWLRKEKQLRCFYKEDPEFREKVHKHLADPQTGKMKNDIDWNDGYIFIADEDGKIDYDGKINPQPILDLAENYVNYEYYRHSSISKEIHKSVTKHIFTTHPNSDICECSGCNRRRMTEHMRWNAYMRVNGYVRGERGDRAKVHPSLCTWAELPYLERFKD